MPILWFYDFPPSLCKKNYDSEAECVGDHCQKHERWVIASYVMSRHDWSLYHVHLQPPQFSLSITGDFCRTLCVSSIYCWRSITGEPGGHPSSFTGGRWTGWLWTFFLLLVNTSRFLQQKSLRRSRLIFPTSRSNQGKMEMGGNNMPALFSRAEDWLFKNSLGISAESVPEQILDHFFSYFSGFLLLLVAQNILYPRTGFLPLSKRKWKTAMMGSQTLQFSLLLWITILHVINIEGLFPQKFMNLDPNWCKDSNVWKMKLFSWFPL